MRTSRRRQGAFEIAREAIVDLLQRKLAEVAGIICLACAVALAAALMSWSAQDPSLNHAVAGPVRNWLGAPGAIVADVMIQLLGLGSIAVFVPLMVWGFRLLIRRRLDRPLVRLAAWLIGLFAACGVAALLPRHDAWPLPTGLGGALGDMVERLPLAVLGGPTLWAKVISVTLLGLVAIIALHTSTVATAATLADPDEGDSRNDTRDDGDGEPGPALVAVSTLVHATISGAHGAARAWRQLREKGLRPAVAGMRDLAQRATAEPEAATAGTAEPRGVRERRKPVLNTSREPAPARGGRIEPRLAASPPPDAPMERRPLDRPAPVADITAIAAPAVATAPPAVRTVTTSSANGYAWAVRALREAARKRLGLAHSDAPSAPAASEAPVATDAPRPGERHAIEALQAAARRRLAGQRIEPRFDADDEPDTADANPSPPRTIAPAPPAPVPSAPAQPALTPRVGPMPQPVKQGRREARDAQPDMFKGDGSYEMPPITLLAEPKRNAGVQVSADALEQNARLLEGVLEDFGVRGEIINVRPGPVVTLYELEPAPGTKSSRVIGLADDIARSMSAISARVAVVPGRNAIGIELPNQRREIVYFREMLASEAFERTHHKLALALGKTIGGEPVIAELAKMPHLLVAGTTGSGKSVAINTMILSLLYRMTPEQCRLIMIDPKMLELSIYEGIPHLLTPVVTDPKKAVVALKWAVREMEDRYRKMSRVGVRNIDGFNARVAEARANGETLTRVVETGFDKETGEILREEQEMDLAPLPYIVVIIDEMADLMMVAGKEIEGAVQRLAQMARAAGIHVIMATQRPSVDVITGTIKANFPTRISFQVTSKIDSRTILGEMGAEQLLGQGDMLHMAGGGRISRVHGPFVSDEEVERVVNHLKRQGRPQYLDAITAEDEDQDADGSEGGPVFDKGEFGAEEGLDLYDQAVRIVLRDKKASTSYVQRRLQIGYNRAASIMERMEKEGVVGPANHAGKREILRETADADEA